MRYKATFAIGLAAGYVLGTKAGRQRYEQIKRTARGLKDNPTVQETAGVVQAQAVDLLSTAKDKAAEAISHTKVADKLAHTKVGEKLGASSSSQASPNGATGPA